MSAWQPIKTIPPTGEVLVCLQSGGIVIAWMDMDMGELVCAYGPLEGMRAGAYWMPLPAPPEGIER